MAFSRDKINKIIGKMKSKSSRNGITESMAQVLHDILSDDELGQSHINPESAFRLIRAKSETELFVKTAAEVQQNEEWYVIATDSTGTFASKAKNYVKKDEDGNFIFETAKNSDVIVFYDDEHNDLDASNKHIRGIHVYEGGVWIAINARFTNYNSANSTASGDYANVEGSGNTASGESAHAEGNATTASGMAAHSEGTNTDAAAIAAHAEGSDTKALGNSSHAEGRLTVAGGAASSAHGYNTMTLPERTAIFGSHAKIGDPDTYFGVGFSANDYREEGKTDANDYNLHLSVKKDGRVLNKDGKEFITADGINDTIDGKLKVYSGESSDDTSTFTITQVKTNGWEFTLPSIIIEKNINQVYIRWPADDDSFYNYLNSFLGQEIHLLESGENISTQSITFTGFGDVIEYTHGSGDSAVRYKQRTAHTTFSSSPDINIIPTENTITEYTFDVHSPIRLLVDNNTTHIRTIEQELTHSITNVASDSSNSVRVVRKEGTAVGDKDYYVENVAEIVQTDEFYIVNPGTGGSNSDIPASEASKYAIKASDGTITYTSPNNGDMAFIYADKQTDITDASGNVDNSNENRIVAILIYEGDKWIITGSYFKNANNINERGVWANAEGRDTTATGAYSHAEGLNTTASNSATHAEGSGSIASGDISHAEGSGSRAAGHYSHAEGGNTQANGDWSHAEGRNTVASGDHSHAQGYKTTANKENTSIMGKFGVVGNTSTVAGIAWGGSEPSGAQITGDADVGLVWKVDKSGNTTQNGVVQASGFLDNNNNVIESTKFVDSISIDNTDDGKIKLGYNDNSTGVSYDWLPNPGNGAGALTLLKVEKDASGKKRFLGSTSADVTAEINSLGDNADNNTKLRGTLIQTGTIAEDKLATDVQTKLNATGSGSTTFTELTDTPAALTGQAGKILQVNTGATALEFTDKPSGGGIALPDPGNAEGAKDIPIVKRVSGELKLLNSTPIDIIEELNGVSPSNADTTGLQGYVLRNDTIAESKLAAAVVTKLNAEDGGANKAIEALASDMEWKVEVQRYNNAETPASPATIGIGYKVFSAGQPNASHRVDFIFPTATSKADLDALVLNRKFVIEVPEGVITFEPTSHVATAVVAGGFHRERYDATTTPSFTGFTYNSDGNNDYQTTLYRGGLVEDGSITETKLSTAVQTKLNAPGRTLTSLTPSGMTPLLTTASWQAISLTLPSGKNIRDFDEIIFRMTGGSLKAEYTARGIEIDTSTTSSRVVIAGMDGWKVLMVHSPSTNAISIRNDGSFTANTLIQVVGVEY